MGPRLTIAAGLTAGAASCLALLVVIVLLVPEPVAPAPSGSPGVSPAASAIPSPAPSPTATVPASIAPTGFHVGEQAPALTVDQLGGGRIDLATLRGRPVWVNFMQTTCPPCRDEFPLMNGFAVRYGESGLVVLAIDVREDEGVIASFAQSLDVRFPIGLDADGSAAAAWDAIALPVHFWIDASGVIRAGALGGIGPDIMAENLATIMPGVDVTP